jgi:hypothetical protein
MASPRLTHRLTIRLSRRLAERLADAALRIDQDASAYVRELLRRELLAVGREAQRSSTGEDTEAKPVR